MQWPEYITISAIEEKKREKEIKRDREKERGKRGRGIREGSVGEKRKGLSVLKIMFGNWHFLKKKC
jgi:hypothetical protein